MGKNENGGQDPHEKSLEAYNDVFADIVNAVLFEGRAMVSEDELEDVKTSCKPSFMSTAHQNTLHFCRG